MLSVFVNNIHNINDVLVQSLMDEREIKLKLWSDGFIDDIKPVIVSKINPYQRKLFVQYKNERQAFLFDFIINAQIV